MFELDINAARQRHHLINELLGGMSNEAPLPQFREQVEKDPLAERRCREVLEGLLAESVELRDFIQARLNVHAKQAALTALATGHQEQQNLLMDVMSRIAPGKESQRDKMTYPAVLFLTISRFADMFAEPSQ